MSWDYAELSKAAKAAGGPEKLMRLIEEGGKAIGRIEGQQSMVLWIGATVLVTSTITAGIIKYAEYSKAKKAISQAAVDEAKTELVQAIKDYDATHPEETDDAATEKGEDSERQIS